MANSTHNKMYSESTYRVGGNASVSPRLGKLQISTEMSAIGLNIYQIIIVLWWWWCRYTSDCRESITHSNRRVFLASSRRLNCVFGCALTGAPDTPYQHHYWNLIKMMRKRWERKTFCVWTSRMEGGKKWRRRRTHISQEEKKPSKNQVIKLFMKLYEKKMKEKKSKAKPSAIDENEWKKQAKEKNVL